MGSIRDGVLAGRSKLIWGRTLTLFFFEDMDFGKPDIDDFGGLGCREGPRNICKGRETSSHQALWKGSWGSRGRPDIPN